MVVRRLIVHDQHQVFDIQATSSNGGGHKHIADACLEIIDGALPVGLILGAMQGQTGVPHLQDSPGGGLMGGCGDRALLSPVLFGFCYADFDDDFYGEFLTESGGAEGSNQ